MSDEGEHAMNEVEMIAGMISLSKGCRALYDSLIEQKFAEQDAMKLTCAWIAGAIGGHRS